MLFSKEERKRIEHSVEKLESLYPIEIVPVFTNKSGVYYMARFRALLLATISAFMLMYVLHTFTFLEWYPFYFLLLMGASWVALVLILSEFIPFISRFLIGKQILNEVTLNKAKEEYVNQEVYSNPQRIGVMVFVSFYERQFHILCDKKGSTFFGEEEWSHVSGELIKAMRVNKPCEAIEHCIEEIGEVMKREVAIDDTLPPSILDNKLRFE